MTDATTCTWMQDGPDSDVWEASCRHTFRLDADTPTDNNMRFCCFCGKPLESAPWADEEITP